MNSISKQLRKTIKALETSQSKKARLRYITNQTYLDKKIVGEKLRTKDLDVYVSPDFEINGEMFSVVLDGHHSLAASKVLGLPARFHVMTKQEHDTIAVLEEAGPEAFIELLSTSEDWRDALTGRLVF